MANSRCRDGQLALRGWPALSGWCAGVPAGYVSGMSKAMADAADVRSEFDDAVTMTAAELRKWLDTEESRAAGQHRDGGESTGHASGRRIVDILQKRRSDVTDSDVEHMRKVVGYVHRHLAQRPSGDVRDSTWRHSLMNWGTIH